MAGTSSQARIAAPWHRFGMGMSVLCLVHCLALPWLLASLPAMALAALPETLREQEWLHAALIGPVLLVSGPALLHGSPGVLRTVLVLTAFAALIGGLFAPGEAAEQALTVAGAALLMAAHWERMREAHRH
jgi:hypothetical protein